MIENFSKPPEQRLGDPKDILVISLNPRSSVSIRVKPRQIIHNSHQLIQIRHDSPCIRHRPQIPPRVVPHIIPPSRQHEAPEPEACSGSDLLGEGAGPGGAGEVAAGGAEVGDAGGEGMGEGEEGLVGREGERVGDVWGDDEKESEGEEEGELKGRHCLNSFLPSVDYKFCRKHT